MTAVSLACPKDPKNRSEVQVSYCQGVAFLKRKLLEQFFFLSRILIDKVVKEKAGKDITDDQDRDQEIEFRDDLHLDSGVKGLDVFHENLHLLGGNLHQVKSYLSLA